MQLMENPTEKKEIEHKQTAFEREMLTREFTREVESYKELGKPGLSGVPDKISFKLSDFNRDERAAIIFNYLFDRVKETEDNKDTDRAVIPGSYTAGIDLKQIVILNADKIIKSVNKTGIPEMTREFQKRIEVGVNGKCELHLQKEIIDECLDKIADRHKVIIILYLFPDSNISHRSGCSNKFVNEIDNQDRHTKKRALYKAVQALTGEIVFWEKGI